MKIWRLAVSTTLEAFLLSTSIVLSTSGAPFPSFTTPMVTRAHIVAPWIRLAWNTSPDPTVYNYNLYWGDFPGHYTNSLTVTTNTALVQALNYDSTYYFSVSAVSAFSTLESDLSPPVSYSIGDPITNLWVTVQMLSSTNFAGPFTPIGTPLQLTNPSASQLFFKVSITKTNY